MQQCEYHSDSFNISMPYDEIVLEKQNTIRKIYDLIIEISGVPEKKRLNFEKIKTAYKALNADAYDQILIVRLYDKILDKFGHPGVCFLVNTSRRQAYSHYMLLSNIAQKIIAEEKLFQELSQ